MKTLNISETQLLFSIITGAKINCTKRISKAKETLIAKDFIRKNEFNILELNLSDNYREQRSYESDKEPTHPDISEALKNNDIEQFLESMDFSGIDIDKNGLEFETWTGKGVNMIYYFHADDGDYFDQLLERFMNFDIDEEIDLHRQDNRYCDHFTHKESVQDFIEYQDRLTNILNIIQTA